MTQRSSDHDRSRADASDVDRVLSASDESALDELVARLRAPHSSADPLGGFVDDARGLDLADPRMIEANLDAVYDEYAATSGRVGTLDFLAKRLRHSPLMRLVAASIAVHALGLPVLAYVTLKPDPQPAYTIHFELPADRPFVEDAPDEGLEALEASDLLESTRGADPADEAESDRDREDG